jgi:hydroxymethylbilane synthase
VASLLKAAHPGLDVDVVTVITRGDRTLDIPVWEMGGRGVFVRAVQAAVTAGDADIAVHSAKDLQPLPAPGLRLAALPERGDPRDALVGKPLSGLAPGAVIATGSQRRRAQLAALRPDLKFQSLRGNIGTRLARVPPGGAIVVAVAALTRLGVEPDTLHVLESDVMLPQVGQGAIAVECRADDGTSLRLLEPLDQVAVRRAVDAERAFLAAVGGACDLPVAGHARFGAEGELRMEGLVAAPDGTVVVRRGAAGPPECATELGREVADMVLTAGGRALLEARGAAR